MATATVKQNIRIERVTATVGAIVHGVGLTDSHSTATADMLRQALHEHGVLFFEFDHFLNRDEFFNFAHLFGTPEEMYGLNPKGMKKKEPSYFDSDVTPLKEYRIDYWHSDGTPFERPPQAASLTPVELPEVGGDTMWASMSAAWEGLSSHHQRLLEGLEALHSTVRLRFLEQSPTAVHPAVIRDPVTGKKLLYVNSNYTERFLDMSERESDALLQMLFEHINTPEFHVRLRWRPGTVAVWEQRVTQHRGVADGFVGSRKLRRLTFAGERPSI